MRDDSNLAFLVVPAIGIVGFVALLAVDPSMPTRIEAFEGFENGSLTPLLYLVVALILTILFGRRVIVAVTRLVMNRFAKGSDDEPIDYDRL
jgi:hypothetical protein